MSVYYIIYLFSLLLALKYHANLNNSKPSITSKKGDKFGWVFIGLIFTLLIGFRDQVGGDWGAYLRHFLSMNYYSSYEIIQKSDPGYYIMNWYFSDWGFEIYSVNVICGAIFMFGLIIFARNQPNPGLAIAVAVPYLIIVVAMGYTRQAVALGFVFWSLASLDQKQFKKFLFLVALAATFHKSAVLMIGLGIFLQGNGRFIRILAVITVGIGIYMAFLADYQDDLWKNYVEFQMESQGAIIRVMMNLIPSLLFILYRKQWQKQFNDYSFWLIIALGSVASVFLVSLASTAVDRIALYFIPIQVVVFSRLPFLLRHKFNPQLLTFGILVYYLLVLYVWLNYATHARYWVPYNNILFEGII